MSISQISVFVQSQPGHMARVLKLIAECGINVNYCYSMISTYIAISVVDLEQAEQLLSNQPVELLDQRDLATMSSAMTTE